MALHFLQIYLKGQAYDMFLLIRIYEFFKKKISFSQILKTVKNAFFDQYGICGFFIGEIRIFVFEKFINTCHGLDNSFDSGTSLDDYWTSSILKPIAFTINGDIIIRDEFDKDANNTEIEQFDMIHSVVYGRCSSFVLKKPRHANDELIMAFVFLG